MAEKSSQVAGEEERVVEVDFVAVARKVGVVQGSGGGRE